MSLFRNTFKILYKKVYDTLPKEYQWRTKRHVQREADTQRLYLLTSYFRRVAAEAPGEGGEAAVATAVVDDCERLTADECEAEVALNLGSQVSEVLHRMHAILKAHNDPLSTRPISNDAVTGAEQEEEEGSCPPSTTPPKRSGLSFLVPERATLKGGPHHSSDMQLESRHGRLTMAAFSAALQSDLGYSLRVAPSGVPHREAGMGVWLRGAAPPGAVVAFYPGVIYNDQQYKFIPGYPNIDRGNSYLLSRYDGHVIDAKPWADGDAYGGTCWPPVGLDKGPHVMDIDGRNPLALAHFANHPPPGKQPNVMVAPVNMSTDDPHLRRYIPNLSYAELSGGDGGAPLSGLCFVATEHIEDEELFLNYRYSPHVPRPAWYVPVDVEEDRRRWST